MKRMPSSAVFVCAFKTLVAIFVCVVGCAHVCVLWRLCIQSYHVHLQPSLQQIVCVRAYVCLFVHVQVTIQNVTDLLWSLQEILRYTQDRVRRDIQYYRQSTWKMYARHVHTHAHTDAYWNNVYAKLHTHAKAEISYISCYFIHVNLPQNTHAHTYTFIQYKPKTHTHTHTHSYSINRTHTSAHARYRLLYHPTTFSLPLPLAHTSHSLARINSRIP